MKLFDLFEMKPSTGSVRINKGNDFVRYIRSRLPNFPEYVLNDWIKELTANKEEFDKLLNEFADHYGPLEKIQWTKEPQILDFRFEMFGDDTKQKIELRQEGEANPHNLPKDKERHDIQAELLKGKNPKDIIVREPVIVFRHGKKYELIEGWHRTVQALKHYPNGYKGYAYIGKPGR